jgi:hypothetical protein
MNSRKIFFLISLWFANEVNAQNYNAIHGSNYSGGLGAYNNPSSLVIAPDNWDVTVIGFQYQTTSNVIKGPNFPFNLFPNATFYMANGNMKRYADATTDLRLLNGRIALNENNAIGFGINVRGNLQAQSTPINYTDSVKGPRSFLLLNEPNRVIELDAASSAWLEIYGSYARTIFDRETGRLNGGASLKILRSMSGAFASARNVGITSEQENDLTVYKINDGNINYGYSANHGDGETFNTSDFLSQAKTGFSIDLGVQYLIKSQAVTSVYDEESAADYDWKLGFSLLDLGWNTYDYSNQSRSTSSLINDVTSFVLQEKFTSVTDVQSFNDSAATIVNNMAPLTGNFKIFNPARAVINVDRYISGNFYLNGELSVNLVSAGLERYTVKESKFLMITPRWENKKFGFYMPWQVNRHGNFWVGAAVKAGPVLLGTHNLLNMFSKNKYLGSGAYLAVTVRPFQIAGGNGGTRSGRSRQYDCPTY